MHQFGSLRNYYDRARASDRILMYVLFIVTSTEAAARRQWGVVGVMRAHCSETYLLPHWQQCAFLRPAFGLKCAQIRTHALRLGGGLNRTKMVLRDVV